MQLDGIVTLPDIGPRNRGQAVYADFSKAALIAVDWGTSRLRARLIDPNSTVLAEASSEEGIGQIDTTQVAGGHEAVFERLLANWPNVPAIMTGMVGSRQGWREAAYVPCPATPASLAREILRFQTSRGRPVAIVPGLKLDAPDRDGDVMRGEETQMIGVIDREPGFAGMCVLPGTHSKWARIEDGRIVGFQTFISGELFDLLAKKSFLRHSVTEGGDPSTAPDFELAVERTARDGLPFVSSLFSVRTRQLLAGASPESNLTYLSGLIIGGEIAAARIVDPLAQGTPVRVVAALSLARAYQKALAIVGFDADVLDGNVLVLDGLAHLARVIGFLPARSK